MINGMYYLSINIYTNTSVNIRSGSVNVGFVESHIPCMTSVVVQVQTCAIVSSWKKKLKLLIDTRMLLLRVTSHVCERDYSEISRVSLSKRRCAIFIAGCCISIFFYVRLFLSLVVCLNLSKTRVDLLNYSHMVVLNTITVHNVLFNVRAKFLVFILTFLNIGGR